MGIKNYTCKCKECNLFYTLAEHKWQFEPDQPPAPKKKAGIAIIKKHNDKSYLLITQSYNNRWGVPKGQQEKDESIVDCAIRELKEESTIDVDISKINKSPYIFVPQYDKNSRIYIYTYVLSDIEALTLDLQNINIDDFHADSTGFGWLNINCSCGFKSIKLNLVTKFLLNKIKSVVNGSC